MQEYLEQLALVTVAGKTHFNREYAQLCISSWKKIRGADPPYRFISDGLRPEDIHSATASGFLVHGRHDEAVLKVLADKPGLRTMQNGSPTWRHVIDSLILCSDRQHVLLIDTDVFVVQPIAFANQALDFVYNVESTPGFRGKWFLPLVEPMVPAINPGFFLLRPSSVSLDVLEDLVRRYFVWAKNYWWTRQSALSVLVGRSTRTGIFDGRGVRVFAGDMKRTPDEIKRNKWKYFGNNGSAKNVEFVEACLGGAAVLHLAGRGKDWIGVAQQFEHNPTDVRMLWALPTPNATLLQSIMISLRMLAIQVGRRRVAPIPDVEKLPT